MLAKLWPTLAIASESVKMVEIGERMHRRQVASVSKVDMQGVQRKKRAEGEGGCRTSMSGQIKRPSLFQQGD